VVWPSCFTPDGTRLITLSQDPVREIRVWDLHRLRQRLRELDLDWDARDYPRAIAPQVAKERPAASLDLGILHHLLAYPKPEDAVIRNNRALVANPFSAEAYFQRGRAYGRLQKHDLAVADYSMFFLLAPAGDARRAEVLYRRSNNHKILGKAAARQRDLLALARLDLRGFPFPAGIATDFHEVARALLESPDRDRRAAQALTLARKAAELEPGNGAFHYTLGMACFRRGQYAEAARVLEKNLERHARYAGFDRYFLAMCYHRLEDKVRAKDHFQRAVRWQKAKEIGLDETGRKALRAIAVEARTLLEQPRPKQR
jgi:tetratricopeptide (TPR) repeat protein